MIDLFSKFDEKAKKQLLKKLNSKKIEYKKDSIIASNLNNIDTIGIILSGKVDIIRYDENGKRTILNTLNVNDIFGAYFTKSSTSELFAIARENSSILFIEYEKIISSKDTNLINNIIDIFSNKILELNDRIELLTKKSIRDKLLDYFTYTSKKNMSKSFYLDMTYTDLSDYLSVDRSALMREIKYLKEDNLIKTEGKKITILY